MIRTFRIFIEPYCKNNSLRRKSASLSSNKKVPRKSGLFYFHQPQYFLPPLTLAIMKMTNAIKPTTRRMPHTIPALKIPSTTEQLPRQKAKKQISEEINNLILFFLFFNQIAYLFSFQRNETEAQAVLWLIGECVLQYLNRSRSRLHWDVAPGLSYSLHHRSPERDNTALLPPALPAS